MGPPKRLDRIAAGAWLVLLHVLGTPPTLGAQDGRHATGSLAFDLVPVPDEDVPVAPLPEPDAYSAAWKSAKARARSCLEEEESGVRMACLRAVEDGARLAIALGPGRPEGHYWLAVGLGLQVDHLGGRRKVAVAAEVYREARATLDLRPGHPGAHHLMGRLQAGVLRMSGFTRFLATRLLDGDVLADASWDEAEAFLKFAELHAPDVPEHHYELGALYRDRGRAEEAAAEARHVLSLPRQPGDEEVRRKAEALTGEVR